MTLNTLPLTGQFTQLPENTDSLFELVGGSVFEVPSNPYISPVAGMTFGELSVFLEGQPPGWLIGVGYMVNYLQAGTLTHNPDEKRHAPEARPMTLDGEDTHSGGEMLL